MDDNDSLKCFKISAFINSTNRKMTSEKLLEKFTEWIRQNDLSFCGSIGEITDEGECKND